LNFYTFGAWEGHSTACPVKANSVSAFHNNENLIYFADSTPDSYLTTNSGGFFIENSVVYPVGGNSLWHPVYIRHAEKANCLIFDMHVESLFEEDVLAYNRWRPRQSSGVLYP
jgi:hypothetical protein